MIVAFAFGICWNLRLMFGFSDCSTSADKEAEGVETIHRELWLTNMASESCDLTGKMMSFSFSSAFEGEAAGAGGAAGTAGGATAATGATGEATAGLRGVTATGVTEAAAAA